MHPYYLVHSSWQSSLPRSSRSCICEPRVSRLDKGESRRMFPIRNAAIVMHEINLMYDPQDPQCLDLWLLGYGISVPSTWNCVAHKLKFIVDQYLYSSSIYMTVTAMSIDIFQLVHHFDVDWLYDGCHALNSARWFAVADSCPLAIWRLMRLVVGRMRDWSTRGGHGIGVHSVRKSVPDIRKRLASSAVTMWSLIHKWEVRKQSTHLL